MAQADSIRDALTCGGHIAMGEQIPNCTAQARPGTIESKPLAKFDDLQSGLVTVAGNPGLEQAK